MREQTKTFVYFVLLILSCNYCSFELTYVNAEDEDLTATASATIVVPENISSTSSSEEKDVTNLENVVDKSSELEPSVDVRTISLNDNNNNNKDNSYASQVFSEIASQNSGVANDLVTNGQPVILTLSDPATAELQQRADIPKVASQPPKETVVNNKTEPALPNADLPQEQPTNDTSEPNVTNLTTPLNVENTPQNLTDEKSEEIPSFSEWAQKRLEEAEKNEQVNSSGPGTNGKQGSGAKLRWKNYASLDCGAKVVAANPESVSPGAILSPSRDEYKLNACTSRIWFIVELCEAIQAKKIDFANYELFSSSPKDFTVSISDRFPSREWSNVGQFTAKDEKDIQSFDLEPQIFGKYIKVEIKSHYGSEHYCPISLFRVYGTSVFEVLQKEDPAHVNRADDDDDDDETVDAENGDSTKNLFSSATDAVISIVKKAAQVLGNKGNYTNDTAPDKVNAPTKYFPLVNSCSTPSHLVVCDNCTDTLFGQVYELLSCRPQQIRNLVSIPFIAKALVNSNSCQTFGFDLKRKNNTASQNSCPDCVKAFFPLKYLGAMCNTVAIMENKVVLNTSHLYNNATQPNVTSEDKLIQVEIKEPPVLIPFQPETTLLEKTSEIQPTDPLTLESLDISSTKSSCSTDISYTSQIKPTKTLSSGLELLASNTAVITEDVEASKMVYPSESVTENQVLEVEETVSTPSASSVEVAEQSLEVLPEVEAVTESVETLDDHLEHFISELNGDAGGNLANAATTSATPQAAQKESVFLRLSNRIKTLERNMSLSSQYLEELSKRYKKQVEEMQRLLEKTIVTLHEESKRKDERNQQLEERLDSLTLAVEALVAEKNTWWSTAICWLLFTVTLAGGVFSWCSRRTPYKLASPPASKDMVEIHRRKSIDVVTHSQPPKKKRRPSDQALKIVRSSTLTNEATAVEKRLAKDRRKNKKKKPVNMRRSNSINTLSEENDYSSDAKRFRPRTTSSRIWAEPAKETDWVEGSSKGIEDIPFALEESEHSTLEPLPSASNGIEAPVFMQTATNVRLNRVSSQNGPVVEVKTSDLARKTNSLDETNMRNNSPSPLPRNGNVSSSTEEHTPKKERKGFKKYFKKVF